MNGNRIFIAAVLADSRTHISLFLADDRVLFLLDFVLLVLKLLIEIILGDAVNILQRYFFRSAACQHTGHAKDKQDYS